MKLREVRDPTEWNALVRGFRYHASLQSWGWGEVKRLSGWRPRRILIEEAGRPVLAAQVLEKGKGPLALAYAPRGPAFDEPAALPEALALLASSLRGGYLKIEPPLLLQEGEAPPRIPGLVPAETIQPECSLVLPLDGEESLLKRMKPKTRYNIRLSGRKGVKTRLVFPGESDAEAAFDAFFRLFTETNQRARLRQHSRAYYEAVFRKMHQPAGEAFLVLAELEGTRLAAGLFVAFGERVDYLYGGSTRARREVMAPYAMHWAAIRYGLERGYRYYDLWGVPRVPNPESHAYGIYRFKEGFGGRRVRFPAYDRPLSPFYRPLVRALRLYKDFQNWRARGTRRDVL